MKFTFFKFSLVPIALLASAPLTGAGPVPSSSSLNAREPLFDDSSVDNFYARDFKRTILHDRSLANLLEEREFLDELTEDLKRRGLGSKIKSGASKILSKVKGGGSSKDRQAKYKTGKVKPETPKGEFRQHMAGRKDDYFANWKKAGGVDNPAAGKGKKPGQKKDNFAGKKPADGKSQEAENPKLKGPSKVDTTVGKFGSKEEGAKPKERVAIPATRQDFIKEGKSWSNGLKMPQPGSQSKAPKEPKPFTLQQPPPPKNKKKREEIE